MNESNNPKENSEDSILDHKLIDVIDFLPDATFIIDSTGKLIAWNSAMEELTRIKAKDVIGKTSYEYSIPFYGQRRPMLIDYALNIAEGDMEKKYSNFQQIKDTLVGEVFFPNLKRGGGTYLWAKARPLYNTCGQIIGAIETIRDITDRKLAEQKLLNRVKELNCLFGIIKVLNDPNLSLGEILQRSVELIPSAWENPDKVCARIVFDSTKYITRNFKITNWFISNNSALKGKDIIIEVYYLTENSFLPEEIDLLREIGNQLKAIFEFKLTYIL